MAGLFDSLTIKSVTLRNRIGVSPMCQYSCVDGLANEWHLVHLGSRAVGGAGLVIVEATAVEPEGRISPEDMGLWSEKHAEAFRPITRFLTQHGAVAGIQLAHAGRKASTRTPWKMEPGKPSRVEASEGGWEAMGPTDQPFAPDYPRPKAMNKQDIQRVQKAFQNAARLACQAGFCWLEVHAAHGYLLHEFLSPLSNQRQDEYGGSFDNRIRFLLETVAAVRQSWPENLPLTVRLSCTDWVEGGWSLEDSIALSKQLKAAGVDLVDCSSGGNVPSAKIPLGPGYQVPFAEAIKKQANILTAAVGMITEAKQADALVREGKADLILMARQMLRDPYFPHHAAKELGIDLRLLPVQYGRA